MDGAGQEGRRPRPVAEVPPVDAVALAKGWLLALVADLPLAQAGSVPAAELARTGPELCSAILEALRSDAQLERLIGSGDRAPLAASVARLTGASTPAALAAGVETLRATIWRALRAELGAAAPEVIGDLSDRLAHVCARIAAAALTEPSSDVPRGAGPLAEALGAPASVRTSAAAAEPDLEEHDEPGGGVATAVRPERRVLADPPEGVHIVDLRASREVLADPLTTLAEELAAAPPAGVRFPPPLTPRVSPTAGGDRVTVTRRRPVDTSWAESALAGPPWLASIAQRLERRAQDGVPFGVLVVEVDDLDRLLASQSGREVAVALEEAERGLTAELAPADVVVRERLGRWWLTSPDRDATSARELGRRVAAAIGRAHLGSAPLAVSVGVAVCPDDGDTLDGLSGRAEKGMFAARAAGVSLTD